MRLHVETKPNNLLTVQEMNVLRLLSQGKLRQQIANELFRSYGTVSKQIEAIAGKLEAHSAAEIVAKAVAMDLVSITLKACLLIVAVQLAVNDDGDKYRQHTPQRVAYLRGLTQREQVA